MKKRFSGILILITAGILFLTGCTADDPVFLAIDDSEPVSVSLDGNNAVIVVDSDGDIILIDEVSRAITTVEFAHHELHEGDAFSCWYEQTVSDTGDKSIIAFLTPNTLKRVHVTVSVAATTLAHGSIFEAVTINDNVGASLSIFNRERNSSTNSTVIDTSANPDVVGQAMFFTEVTQGSVTGGTELSHVHLGVGDKKAVGGEARATIEWVLLQNTLYAFIVESVNNDDNTHVVMLNWYEHTSE